MQHALFNTTHLKPLREEGLFVSIMPKEDDLIVECRIYITDRDEETRTTTILEVHGDNVRDDSDRCIACKARLCQMRSPLRGSISCPLCGSYTEPYSLVEKVYRGKLGSKLTTFPSAMAQKISAALKHY